MTLVVPAVLGGLAVVLVLVSITASRRQRARTENSAFIPSILVHAINDDRCTGCDACVAVCPTNVLDLISNKSRVLRFQDCIQCEACMWACPTEALVMFREGTEPPPLKIPEVDEFYQTAVPGQYLVGEIAGKPLVKNAANLGRAAVEHMLTTGLTPRRRGDDGIYDVAIVGSGPAGLSAALACIHHGLSYVLLEKEQILASTVARYPKGKLIMAEPYDTRNLSFLPVFDSSKEELIPIWAELIEDVGMEIRRGEVIDRVEPVSAGHFEVESNVSLYRANRVVLATGTRGKPRTLGVPGENLAKVFSLLEDPDEHRGRPVLVVGGGDSALEATIALADAGAKVILSYRGRSFARAQPKLKSIVEGYESQKRLKIQYQSVVDGFDEETVTLRMMDGSLKKYPNEAAFVLVGSEPPIKWLNKVGVQFTERPHSYALPQSDQLLLRLVGDLVYDCPEDAQGAVASVTGREPPARPQTNSGRKWLRSASHLFGRARTLDGPMPLGEFARSSRKHKGRGRRDALPPSERTRVLRMLRDEGARLADEDSSVNLFRPPTGQVEWADDIGEFVSPPGLPGVGRADSPARLEERSPKKAVIVGLAQAAARGPIGSERRRAEAVPHQRDRVDTGELLEGLIKKDRAEKRASRPPSEPFFDEPTRVAGYDPKRLLAEAEQGGHRQAQPNEVTALVDFDAMISQEANAGVVADSITAQPTRPERRPGLPEPGRYDADVLTSDTKDEPLDRFAELERHSHQGYDQYTEDAATRQVDIREDRLASLGDVEDDSEESADKVEFD